MAKLFVAPRFQIHYLLLLMFAGVVPIMVSAISLHYFIGQFAYVSALAEASDPTLLLTFELETDRLKTTLFFLALVHIVGLLVLGMFFSRRAAFTIYRLRSAMKEISAGKDAQMEVGQRDEFNECAREFNNMVAVLRKQTKAD